MVSRRTARPAAVVELITDPNLPQYTDFKHGLCDCLGNSYCCYVWCCYPCAVADLNVIDKREQGVVWCAITAGLLLAQGTAYGIMAFFYFQFLDTLMTYNQVGYIGYGQNSYYEMTNMANMAAAFGAFCFGFMAYKGVLKTSQQMRIKEPVPTNPCCCCMKFWCCFACSACQAGRELEREGSDNLLLNIQENSFCTCSVNCLSHGRPLQRTQYPHHTNQQPQPIQGGAVLPNQQYGAPQGYVQQQQMYQPPQGQFQQSPQQQFQQPPQGQFQQPQGQFQQPPQGQFQQPPQQQFQQPPQGQFQQPPQQQFQQPPQQQFAPVYVAPNTQQNWPATQAYPNAGNQNEGTATSRQPHAQP